MERGIVLVGLNHRSAPVEVRERVAFANGRLEPPLRRLVAVAGVAEGAILSTCNRVEVLACGPDPTALGAALPGFLASEHGVPEPALAGHLYTHTDREAVRHLFRVAASLDSMVVGEPQILGQLKEQYAAAAAAGASGQILHRCFHRSFSVAKRIRRETRIAERAVSIGSAAVELSRSIFDRLADKSALLLGAGTMGELTARQLLAQGVGSVMVANRTFDRAIDVARTLGAMPVPWDRLPRYLPLADLVIAAASGEEFLLPRAAIEEAMHERRHRAMFLIDLAVPRALDPAVNQLDNVYLYDIDDLEGVVTQNRGARAREAAKAETIVDAEVDTFWRWYTSLDVVPTIVALRERVEAIRRYEVERSLAALGALDPRQREALERLTQAIVNKVLHAPLTALRRHRADPAEAFYVEAARRLFRLGTGATGEASEERSARSARAPDGPPGEAERESARAGRRGLGRAAEDARELGRSARSARAPDGPPDELEDLDPDDEDT
ncbi:MAG: glutamyl-tRNA reductase [Deltaproteobacteria bacterium]|nr:MAG: glutamyl-tRNA reductase [Deltaproteobacteria bacterium]